MPGNNYKKYMKKSAKGRDYSLIQLFVISFFGMLLVFTVLIKSFSPSVDVSIGDYKQETELEEKTINVDDRLAAIQSEDQGRSFTDLMKNADDIKPEENDSNTLTNLSKFKQKDEPETVAASTPSSEDSVYKEFIGT